MWQLKAERQVVIYSDSACLHVHSLIFTHNLHCTLSDSVVASVADMEAAAKVAAKDANKAATVLLFLQLAEKSAAEHGDYDKAKSFALQSKATEHRSKGPFVVL